MHSTLQARIHGQLIAWVTRQAETTFAVGVVAYVPEFRMKLTSKADFGFCAVGELSLIHI